MQQRSRVFDIAIMVIFALVLAASEVSRWTGYTAGVAPTELRPLASKPVFTWSELAAYPPAFEHYFNERFGLRNALIRAHGLVLYKLMRANGSQHGVIRGEGDWLFYDPTYLSDGIGYDASNGRSPLTAAELLRDKENLEGIASWLAARHIVFVIVLCPDKHTVYPEYLPEYLRRSLVQETRLAQFVRYMKEQTSLPIVDLRPALMAAKTQHLTYWKTDTHWNDFGAFVGYTELMKALQQSLPEVAPLPLTAFELTVAPNHAGGDLARMLAVGGSVNDETVTMKLKPEVKVTPVIGKLLTFNDSFFQASRPFIERHVRQLVTTREEGHQAFQPVDLGLVAKEKPDVVLLQVVERYWVH